VRVVYSDESGTSSVQTEPITVIAAIMLNIDSQWDDLDKYLNSIAPSPSFEFKGSRLLHDCASDKTHIADRAIHLLSALMLAPRRYLVPIFYGAVHREGYRKANAHWMFNVKEQSINEAQDHAFYECLERVDTYVHTLLPDEKVLWIADGPNPRQRPMKSGLSFFQALKQVGVNIEQIPYARDYLPEEREREPVYLSHVIDTLYFGDSKESRALQLADVCCSIITQHLLGNPLATRYYRIIQTQIVNHGTAPSYVADPSC
jgi:hypothetical protein